MNENHAMESSKESGKTPGSIGNRFSQVAWVVPDIEAAERFFLEVIGVPSFVKMENLEAQDLEGTYYGQPADFEFHLYMAYSGDSMLELIQPVSGRSLFSDFLDRHGHGGVQHVAYAVPESEFDPAVTRMKNEQYDVVQSLHLPVAHVAYFDTRPVIGVATEIIGVTEEGVQFIEQLKSESF